MGIKNRPGEVRTAVLQVLSAANRPMAVREIEARVIDSLGRPVPGSSVRSILRLSSGESVRRVERGCYEAKCDRQMHRPERSGAFKSWRIGQATLVQADCLDWIASQAASCVHAVVTDPPYGLVEYRSDQQKKLRERKGGVWRIPPTFDGANRSPLPRFTVLKQRDLIELHSFFRRWGEALLPILVPGANVVVASNPLVSHVLSCALADAGLERRGEIVRLVQTMRGGDRPKGAHEEFPDVSVMPRSQWEPWVVFRRPIEGTVRDNLRKWGTGGFRRLSDQQPFGDVIRSSPTQAREKEIAPHPSLKPQAFMRAIVRGALALGEGVVLDPFVGGGSTLAAAEHVGYESIGIESDAKYAGVARRAIPQLAALEVTNGQGRSTTREVSLFP